MNKYRSHNCNELRSNDVGKKVILSGWINKKRDHGNLLFLDLRDNFGITQCIINNENSNFTLLEKIQLETVVKIDGKVVNRSDETINKEIETGQVEVVIEKDWPDEVTQSLPNCSAKPEEICKTWRITGYSYLNPNI